MASRILGTRPVPPSEPLSARELVDKYSGVGLQFKVKFVGSENVNRKRGDAEAAKYCIPTLKVASQQSRIHKPRCALGLSLKGISLFDESTKNITRVPLEKVTYVSHDPVDVCYIGVIVSDKDSHTGFKLYCFKAEKVVAVTIVNSAKELFELMFKLRKARKKLKEEKEKEEKDNAEANTSPDHSNLPAENAPPPSYNAVSTSSPPQQQQQQQVTDPSSVPPERPPPPRPVQPPPLPPRNEEELFSFSLDPPPSNPNVSSSQTTSAPTITPSDSLFSGFEDLNLNEPMVSIATQPQPQQPPLGGANPFSGMGGGMQQQQPMMINPPDAIYSEPSITMDLMDAIKNPVPGTTSYYNNPGMGTGMGTGMGMGMGGGTGMGMGGAGMGMGGAGMGMGMGGGNQFGGNTPGGFGAQFGGMQQQQQPQQPDIFSMPADPMMNAGFSEPLLPTNTGSLGQQQSTNTSKPQNVDAFSGLVDVARNKVKTSEPPAVPSPANPPRYSTLYTGGAADQKITETFDFSLPPPAPPHRTGGSSDPPPPSFPPPNTTSQQQQPAGSSGFDDFFGGSNTSQQQPGSQQSPWVSF